MRLHEDTVSRASLCTFCRFYKVLTDGQVPWLTLKSFPCSPNLTFLIIQVIHPAVRWGETDGFWKPWITTRVPCYSELALIQWELCQKVKEKDGLYDSGIFF